MLGLEETTGQLNRLANAINQKGLNGPAIVCLVAVRPFRYVLNQLMLIAAPLFGSGNALGQPRYSWLLEDSCRFDQLISMLENPVEIEQSEAGNE